MTVLRETVNRGLHQLYDVRGTYLPGEAEVESQFPILWGGDGGRILSRPPSDPARMGEGTSVVGGPTVHFLIQDIFLVDSSDSGIPILGMQGVGRRLGLTSGLTLYTSTSGIQ